MNYLVLSVLFYDQPRKFCCMQKLIQGIDQISRYDFQETFDQN